MLDQALDHDIFELLSRDILWNIENALGLVRHADASHEPRNESTAQPVTGVATSTLASG